MTEALLLGMSIGAAILMAVASFRTPPIKAIPTGSRAVGSRTMNSRDQVSANKRVGRAMDNRTHTDSPPLQAPPIKESSERSVLLNTVNRIPLFSNATLSISEYISSSNILNSYLSTTLLITGVPLQSLCAESLFSAIAGLVIVPLFLTVIYIAGIHIPAAAVILLGAAGAVAAASMPVFELISRAHEMRDVARRAVSSYIDLVVLCLAGGMGIEGALFAAAGVGDNWFYERIRRTLRIARRSGGSMWEHIGILGEELDLPELKELAVAVGLASSEGARVKATLSAKAASMRKRELAESEMRANRATERLFLPSMLLLLGFLLFIGYPATTRILGGL